MPRAVRYSRLPTEQRHPRSETLDRLSPRHLVGLMHREDMRVVRAVGRELPRITRAIRLVAQTLRHGGRLIFVGAGTSGRLGVLEAVECPPTFHTAPSTIQAILAGGRGAIFRSREGAEDRRAEARDAVRAKVRRGDVVVGVSASGVTPFVDEALKTARRRHARTVLITCADRTTMPADVRIALSVGPELLTGSTRLKSGTATKLVLNMLTLGVMAQCGKIYGNLMVDVRPTSRKLRARAIGIVRALTSGSARAAAQWLQAAGGRVPVAVLMARTGLTRAEATRRLAAANGSLRLALQTDRCGHGACRGATLRPSSPVDYRAGAATEPLAARKCRSAVAIRPGGAGDLSPRHPWPHGQCFDGARVNP